MYNPSDQVKIEPGKLKLQWVIMIAFFAISTMITLFFIISGFNKSKKDLLSELDKRLLMAVDLARESLPDNYHDIIIDRNSISSEEYFKIVEKFDRLCIAHELKYLWSLIQIDGVVYFSTGTSESKVEHQNYANFFDVHSNQQAYDIVFETMEIQYLDISDEWGDLRSVLVPAVDSQGRKFLFGASIETDIIKDMLQQQLKDNILSGIIFLVAGLTFSIILSRYITDPLNKLIKHCTISIDGNYREYIQKSWIYELDFLSKSFNGMIETIENQFNQLSESKENLRVTLDSIGDAVIATDTNGQVTRMNPVASSLTGWSFSEAAGKPLSQVFNICNSHSRAQIDNPVQLVLEHGEVVGLANHTMLIAKDGSEYQIADSAAPIKDDLDNIIGVVLVFRDVSEEYEMLEKLKKSESELKKAQHLAKLGNWELDVENEKLIISNEMQNILGVESKEQKSSGINNFMESLIYPKDREIIKNNKQKSGNYQSSAFLEYRIVRQDNQEIRWVLASASLSEEKFGRTFVFGTIQDITERKRIEEEIRKEKQFIDAAVDSLPGIFYLFTMEGKFLRWNKNFELVSGYSANEISNMHPLEFFPVEDQSLVDERIKEVFSKGESYAEAHWLSKDGTKTFHYLTGVRIDFDGTPCQVGMGVDISKRRQAELELRESEKQYRDLIDNMSSGCGIYVTQNGIDFFLKHYNRSGEKMDNVNKNDLIGRNLVELFPDAESKLKVQERFSRVWETGKPERIPASSYDVEGLTVWRENYIYKLPTSEIVVIFDDITERKRAEEELRYLRNYLENIINSMPSLLVGVDVEGKVTQWNKEAENKTGLVSKDVVGQSLNKVFPRRAEEVINCVADAVQNREVRIIPQSKFTVNNETYIEEVTVYPLIANGIEGAVIRVDDVTERVRIDEMIVQNEKMLSVGGLAAGMAHEINNPLGGMIQTVAVMSQRLMNPNMKANQVAAEDVGTSIELIRAYLEKRKIVEMIDRIRESGSRIAEIVANMLSFARKSDSMRSTQDLAQLLDQCVDLAGADYDLKKKHDFRQIEIVREYGENFPLVPCDAGKIQQVFLNLLRNGAESIQERRARAQGEVPRFILRLMYENGADMVHIEIEDNGIGMDEETRKRAFEPFFTTKPSGQGTGLGLSVSYFIISENHNGKMYIESIQGRGTKFIIALPVETSNS